ncbi:MAG: endonuclease domain-containing protein [Ignavibacteriae bacterium]|nr:endonuclease domain-containing protein [Ignavibacteriota bacterium]
MHKQTIEAAKQRCRELHKHQTPSERHLWQSVRNRSFLGKKFNRQFPIFFTNPSGTEGFYIADFYCHEHRLVVELDGKSHYFQQEYDAERSDILHGMGLQVVRFRNDELAANFDDVLQRLKKTLGTHPHSLS